MLLLLVVVVVVVVMEVVMEVVMVAESELRRLMWVDFNWESDWLPVGGGVGVGVVGVIISSSDGTRKVI